MDCRWRPVETLVVVSTCESYIFFISFIIPNFNQNPNQGPTCRLRAGRPEAIVNYGAPSGGISSRKMFIFINFNYIEILELFIKEKRK